MKTRDQIDFPVIDTHVHLYPDTLACKVTPELGERFGNTPSFDGTISGCIKKALSSNLALSINVPVATEARQVAGTNKFWSDYARVKTELSCENPQVLSLASLHPEVEDKIAEIEKIKKLNFTGIKFHPEYQKFHFNDSFMDVVWEKMSEENLVAFLHAGGERVFKAPYHSSPKDIALLQKRFPKLKIVAAHLGGFSMWDEAEKELVGSSVYLDLSHTFFWMSNDQIFRMIRNHSASRILFGTDAPWQDAGKVLDALLALDLTHEELKQICYSNAKNLFIP